MNTEVAELIERVNTQTGVQLRIAMSDLEKHTMVLVREANPKYLAEFLKMCILHLNTVPSIRVLRASFRARTNCAPWRPMCVKVFYEYSKQVGEETARADMAGLFEDFIQ